MAGVARECGRGEAFRRRDGGGYQYRTGPYIFALRVLPEFYPAQLRPSMERKDRSCDSLVRSTCHAILLRVNPIVELRGYNIVVCLQKSNQIDEFLNGHMAIVGVHIRLAVLRDLFLGIANCQFVRRIDY